MNCTYCKQTCEQISPHRENQSGYWKCSAHPCPVYFLVNANGTISEINISVVCNGGEYEWRLSVSTNKTYILQAFYDAEMIMGWTEPIPGLDFPGLLPVTPENATQKLKLILLFL